MDNTAFFKLSYGLFVITAKEGEKDNGCITNTVVQVTTTPNRVTVAIKKGNYTHDMILHTGLFNVSVISQKASFDLFKHWGFQSGRDVAGGNANHGLAPLGLGKDLLDVFSELLGLGGGHVHFPVAGNDGFTISAIHSDQNSLFI